MSKDYSDLNGINKEVLDILHEGTSISGQLPELLIYQKSHNMTDEDIHTVFRNLDKLGYIKCTFDPENINRQKITLTQKCHDYYDKTNPLRQ